MPSAPRLRLSACLLGAALVACADHPLAPTSALDVLAGPIQPAALQTLDCRVTMATRRMSCDDAGTADASRLVLGGQGLYVNLAASNPTYVVTTLESDVTVQSLIPQPLATTDGVSPDAEGVRVFFHDAPTVTLGTGVVTVQGTDGTGTWTGTGQPFYRYSSSDLGGDGLLSQNETSAARRWSFDVPVTVLAFTFRVYVATEVQFPAGYIDITPSGAPLLLAEDTTLTLSTVVRRAVGVPAADQSVTWGTSDAGKASVNGSNLLTASGVGAATVTATQGPRSGALSVMVCPNLLLGEAYTFASADDAAFCVASQPTVSEYTLMPLNLSSASATSITVTGTGVVAVTGPPTPARLPAPANTLRLVAVEDEVAMEELSARDRWEWKLRELELRTLPSPAAARAAAALEPERFPGLRQGRGEDGAQRLITPGVPVVGDSMDLNVAQGCAGALDSRRGVVRSVGTHIIIVADTANPAGGFSTAQFDSIALEYDTIAHPVVVPSFGAPTDLDGNGRVVAFFTRAVNELSPPASSVVTLGYFTSRDLFSSAPASCPRSNEGEMFYMLVPDPTGAVNSNVRTVSFVRGNTVGTLGHEAQHLINASRRLYINSAPVLEEVWLNEGLSHMAEELMFYRTSVGLAPKGNIVVTQLTTGPNASRRVAAYNTYANQNFGRLRGWLQRPDTAGAFKNNDGLATRGAIWSFLRYASDRANNGDPAFLSALVNSQTSGVANLQGVLGTDPLPWLRDMTTAMYADDAGFTLPIALQQQSWSFRSIYTALNGSYQLVPRNLTSGVPLTLSYSRGGGATYIRFAVPANTPVSLTVNSGGSPIATPHAVTIVRTK